MKRQNVNQIDSGRVVQLETQLSQSAFRRGTSAFRLGLILEAPSDHLPIHAFVNPSNSSQLQVMSWNLLADSHLYNNFMNISGSHLLANEILNAGVKNIYISQDSNMLYHFFSELSQFLYERRKGDSVQISSTLLREFVKLDNQPSRLTRSRSPEAAKEKERLAEASRQQIIDLMLNVGHEHHGEFKLAVQHSLELIHHILGDQGALQWKNRFERINQNRKLKFEMSKMDFICLQECTLPKDIVKMLNYFEDHFGLITHRTDTRSDDHCAILFDQKSYVLEKQINYAIDNKKPAIFARFYPKGHPDKAFIIASIHYPGGNHHVMDVLLEQIESLKLDKNEKIDFFMLGDFNHTADFFEDSSALNFAFPIRGTMAGSDYGNTNQSIDALVTNLPESDVDVGLMSVLPVAAPSNQAIKITFNDASVVNRMSLFACGLQASIESKLFDLRTKLFGEAKVELAVF